MQPIQELWIADGDETTIRFESDWFVASRGTIYALISLPSRDDRLVLWRQHGGETVWYSMLAEVEGLDALEGTCWDLGRNDGGDWYPPQRRDDLEPQMACDRCGKHHSKMSNPAHGAYGYDTLCRECYRDMGAGSRTISGP